MFFKDICLISGSASIRSSIFYLLVHNFSKYAIQR